VEKRKLALHCHLRLHMAVAVLHIFYFLLVSLLSSVYVWLLTSFMKIVNFLPLMLIVSWIERYQIWYDIGKSLMHRKVLDFR